MDVRTFGVRKILLLFLILMVFFVIVCIYLGINKLSQTPFFVNKGLVMGITNMKLYTFQPVYLWSYERNNGLYIKAFYLSKWYIPWLVDLWLSGDRDEIKLEKTVFVDENNKVEQINDFKSVQQKLKFGHRFRVEYVTGVEEYGLTTQPMTEFCKETPRICQIQEFVRGNMDKYSAFSNGGLISTNTPLPVLGILMKLEK